MLVLDSERIERLRLALDHVGYDRRQRALRGSYPRVPYPPYREFSATLRRLPLEERTWFDLLLLGRAVGEDRARSALGELVDDLLSLGVLLRSGKRLRTPGLGLVAHSDRYFLADLDPAYPAARKGGAGVYIGAASYRLAAELPLGRRFASVLDLCSGSGLLGILMAPVGGRVTLSDVSPDSEVAGRFNAILNGVGDRVEVVCGDLWAPLGGRRFELVVFNSPFVPHPPEVPGSPATGGGIDGLDLVRPLLSGLPGHLVPEGFALAYFEGDGDREGPFLERRLEPVLRRAGLDAEFLLVDRITRAERMRQVRAVYSQRGERFRAGLWRDWLDGQGATHYYLMVARLRAGTGRVRVERAIPRA